MQNDNDTAKEFKDKIDTLLKELDDKQSDKIWKGTLRQSANVLKKEIQAAYRAQLHQGKYKKKSTGRTVQNIAVKDVSKKKYPLKKFDIQYLAGVLDEGEDSTYKGFGRAFTSFWFEKGTRPHSNTKGDYLRDKHGPRGNSIINGIPAHYTQTEILEAHADNFITEYQQRFIKNLTKAVNRARNKK